MDTELTPAMRRFLDEKRFAVLATSNTDGSPQQSVMWYLLEEDTILMNTKRGRLKERNMRRDPRVSVCVEDEYRFVSISGYLTLLDDQPRAQADIKRLSTRYHGPEKAEEQSRDQFSKEHRVTVLLSIASVTSDGF